MNERAIAEGLVAHVPFSFATDTEKIAFVDGLAEIIRRRCGEAVNPQPGETLALSVMRPKTAALAFDRVYRIPIMNEPIPMEVGFYGATLPEIVYSATALMIVVAEELGIRIPFVHDNPNNRSPAENERRSLTLLCSDLDGLYGTRPTIFYHNRAAREADFLPGSHEVLIGAITNVAMVDEDSVSWEQVLEFRRDLDARIKYLRLVRWIDAELRSKSALEIGDLIAIRLNDYEWALKKHGISTCLGTISSLLDPKFLGATSAAVAATALSGDKFWAALVGLSLTVGRAAVNLASAKIAAIDQLRSQNYELAYVHELKRRLSD